jgi:hypothetical protein
LQLKGFSQADTAHKKMKLTDSLLNFFTALNSTEQRKIIKSISKDTSEARFLKDSLKIIAPKLIRTEARIDSRASTFQKTQVNIYGYYIGVMIKSKLSLGLGYYRINTVLPVKTIVNGININTSLVVNCGSINSELIYYNRRYISLGFPVEFAFGQYNLTNTLSENNQLAGQQIKFLAFSNFGLSGTFKPFKFIGLKFMAGYRKSIYPEEKTFEFNGVYSSLGLYVDVVDLASNIRMYKLLKRYHKVSNPLSTYVDLFTD